MRLRFYRPPLVEKVQENLPWLWICSAERVNTENGFQCGATIELHFLLFQVCRSSSLTSSRPETAKPTLKGSQGYNVGPGGNEKARGMVGQHKQYCTRKEFNIHNTSDGSHTGFFHATTSPERSFTWSLLKRSNQNFTFLSKNRKTAAGRLSPFSVSGRV